MGTQQILMIILSVIIVGTSIAVGIQMFDRYHSNITRQQISFELDRLRGMVAAWYRTPIAMGGGGNGLYPDGTVKTATTEEIAKYLNSSYYMNGTTPRWDTILGRFEITANAALNNVTTSYISIYCTPANGTTKTLYLQCYINGEFRGTGQNT